ncbi:putative F-box protein [Panicum miliaceum]|uniref:F-box protein n=1 Tax=Panicum miliaceum TaxID=4540 RepID=A0A3L6RBN3_PANMI|nr:putative F-box protein [Panicum miliaceum]
MLPAPNVHDAVTAPRTTAVATKAIADIYQRANDRRLQRRGIVDTVPANPVLDDAGDLQRYDLSFYDATLPRKENQPPQPYAADRLRRVLYLKVVLSCDPSRVFMMIHNPDRQLSFARRVALDTTSFWVSQYSDCIYHGGTFYAMNLLGGIHRYTIEGSCVTRDIVLKDTLPYMAYNMYIARTSSGEFLQIWRITTDTSEDSLETRTSDLEVFKVDLDNQQTVDIDTLGDESLFIGHNYSCCISTRDYPRLRPNHVYFTDDDEYSLMNDQDYRRDVGVYSLGNISTTEIVTPEPWLSRPIPIWITPSFTKINK